MLIDVQIRFNQGRSVNPEFLWNFFLPLFFFFFFSSCFLWPCWAVLLVWRWDRVADGSNSGGDSLIPANQPWYQQTSKPWYQPANHVANHCNNNSNNNTDTSKPANSPLPQQKNNNDNNNNNSKINDNDPDTSKPVNPDTSKPANPCCEPVRNNAFILPQIVTALFSLRWKCREVTDTQSPTAACECIPHICPFLYTSAVSAEHFALKRA